MQFSPAFDGPLRRRARIPVTGRIGAVVTTLAAHLLVIAALIQGLRQAEIIRPPEVTVRFNPEPARPPPVMPEPVQIIAAFTTPSAPVFDISPRAAPAAPAPPMMLPSPPSANAGGTASNAEPSWETALLTRLAQARHLPVSGRGVVLLRFTMDRDGKVLGAGIEKSSGLPALDQEALAALARAQPLPAPPPELPGTVLDLIVPVDFL